MNNLNHKALQVTLALLACLLIVGALASSKFAFAKKPGQPAQLLVQVGSGFTYQGILTQSGGPANGQYDFAFTLYDAPAGGNQVGFGLSLPNEQVTNGLFNVTLDFGPDAFLGDARWLEIAVQVAGGGEYTTLAPRQPLTPAPYAQSAPWRGVTGKPWLFNSKRSPNTVTAIDSAGTVGQYASLVVGVDERALVSYYDATNGDLKVAHCNNLECTGATITTLDSTGDVGRYTTTIIGSDGLGLIVYFEGPMFGNGNLKVAHCDNLECTSATITTLGTASSSSTSYPSVAIGTDQLPLISYRNTATQLVIRHCTDTACTGSIALTLASEARATSITIGSDGLGLAVFQNGPSGLKAAHCNNVACTSAGISTIDSTSFDGYNPSVIIGADGLPLITYATGDSNDSANALKTAHCSRPDCALSTTTVHLGYARFTELPTSLTIGPDGLGIFTFFDSNIYGHWLIGRCLNTNCTTYTTAKFDQNVTFPAGTYSSLLVGPDGLPMIAYYDTANGDLKVQHCATPQCTAYQKNGR